MCVPKKIVNSVTGMVTLLSLTTMVSAQNIDDIDREFNVQPGGTLTIISDAGPIDVRTWSEPRVVVEIRNADAFEVSFEQSGNNITVIAEEDRGRSRIRYNVTVPSEFNLDLDTGGGAIDIADITGHVTADTSGGSITIGLVQSGDVFADTSGGRIEVRGATSGNVTVDTSGGRIDIGDVVGNVSADTSGGGIDIGNVDGDVYADTSGGSINVGEVTGRLELETSGGTIRAGYSGGIVDVSTSGGNIVLAGGEGSVRARTAGGNIRIDNSNGPVSARTAGGNVDIGSVRGSIDASTAGGSIKVTLAEVENNADADINLRTSGGDVDLTIPANHRATVSASIEVSRRSRGDYRIYTDFPLTITGQDEREVIARGDINGGGDRISIETNNGDIRILSAED